MRIFAPTCQENRLHFDALLKVIAPGEFEFVSRDSTELLKSDCNMLATTTCSDKARARARTRLELALKNRRKVDTNLSIWQFRIYFGIDSSECTKSTKPVPDFLEAAKIKMLRFPPYDKYNRIFKIKPFIFNLDIRDSEDEININEFESCQEHSDTETDKWPNILFCAIFPEGRLYLRFVDEGNRLEVLDPTNGNLDRLQEFDKSDEETLDPSGFWTLCPEDFEDAKQYLM